MRAKSVRETAPIFACRSVASAWGGWRWKRPEVLVLLPVLSVAGNVVVVSTIHVYHISDFLPFSWSEARVV